MLRFAIRDLIRWVTMAAVLLALLRAFGVLGGSCSFVVLITAYFALDRLLHGSEHNVRALWGAVAGVVIGGAVGALSGFGRVVLRFRPDLPEQDFEVAFGAIAGAFLGAVIGALILSLALPKRQRL